MSQRNSATFALKSAIALVCLASSPATAVDQVFNSNLSFVTQDQSMWDSGEAFMFDYLQFFGIDPAPRTTVVNPAAVSGGTAPFSHWTVDPYFQFLTDSKLGIEIGAEVNGGSIDANLDYHVSLEAFDDIVAGTPFSLTGIATKQVTSSFQSSPANAEAWVDGVVQASLGGYARITTGGSAFVFGTHDYRMGNSGFTDDPASNSNNPYRSLINVNEKPEIIGINRNESGQLHVLGQNQGGTGSEYVLGPTTITAGNWNVSATGALDGAVVQGSDEKVLVTASLDIDQMATTAAGLPPLGAGVAHDYGAIAFDIGYEILDVKAVLELGLRQDFSITSDVTAHLQFSENVMIDGLGETNSYLGPLDTIPDITLLSNSVTVIPEFIVAAQLNNDTDLTVTESLPITLFEGHADFSWDVAGVSGSRTNGFGPVFQDTPLSNTNAIDVYSNQFALGGFDVIQGDSFVLQVSLRWTDTTPGGSNFNTVANWSTNTMPSAADNAKIDNGGTAIVNSTAAIRNLRVGGTPEGGTLQLDPGGDLTANELSVSANGTVNFQGGSLSAASYALDDATLHVAQNATQVNAAPVALTGTNRIDVDSGGLFDQTEMISGTGGLTKQGLGTLVLSAANTYTGGTTIEQGIVRTEADNVIPRNATFNFRDGTLDLSNNFESVGPGAVAVNGLVFAGKLGATPQILLGSSGSMTVSTLGTFITYDATNNPGTARIIGTGTSQLNLATSSISRDFDIGDSNVTEELIISTTIVNTAAGGAPNDIRKLGAGRLVLAGNGNFSKGVAVNAGALEIRHATALGLANSASTAGTTVANGASLELSGSIAVGNEHLTLSGVGDGGLGSLRSKSGSNSWAGPIVVFTDSTIGVDADELSIFGAMSGPGSLTKSGPGTLLLEGSNTYAGGTTINEGSLGGNGSLTGGTTVISGGMLAPGASTGLFTVDDIDFTAGSIFAVEIASDGGVAGADFDQLVVNNTATVNGALLDIDLLDGFVPTAGDSFEILSASVLNGTFDGGLSLPALAGQLAWNVNYDTLGNRILLEVLTPFTADFDGDGDVDGGDFLSIQRTNPAQISAWQSQFGSGGSASGAAATVPEPSACVMLLWGVLTLILRRQNA